MCAEIIVLVQYERVASTNGEIQDKSLQIIQQYEFWSDLDDKNSVADIWSKYVSPQSLGSVPISQLQSPMRENESYARFILTWIFNPDTGNLHHFWIVEVLM